MKREVNEEEEELRLQNSPNLIYGNKDTDRVFPFDERMRFKYVVYHEALGVTEDGQVFSKVSTRQFTFISPKMWDNWYMPKTGRSFFENQGKSYTILHDPLEQAKLEGVKIKGYHIDKTGQSLKDKLRNAKSATQVVKKEESIVYENEQFEEIDRLEEVVVKKGGRPRKEIVENG